MRNKIVACVEKKSRRSFVCLCSSWLFDPDEKANNWYQSHDEDRRDEIELHVIAVPYTHEDQLCGMGNQGKGFFEGVGAVGSCRQGWG